MDLVMTQCEWCVLRFMDKSFIQHSMQVSTSPSHPVWCVWTPSQMCWISFIEIVWCDYDDKNRQEMWFDEWIGLAVVVVVCVFDGYSIFPFVFWQIHILWICEWIFTRMGENVWMRDWIMMMKQWCGKRWLEGGWIWRKNGEWWGWVNCQWKEKQCDNCEWWLWRSVCLLFGDKNVWL